MSKSQKFSSVDKPKNKKMSKSQNSSSVDKPKKQENVKKSGYNIQTLLELFAATPKNYSWSK